MISFDLARDVPDDVDLVVEGVTDRLASPTTRSVRAPPGSRPRSADGVAATGRLLVGLGEQRLERRRDDAALRTGARAAGGATPRPSASASRPTLPATQAVAEGFSLGAYRFTKYRSDPKPNRDPIGDRGRRRRTARLAAARARRADRRGRRASHATWSTSRAAR